jgi:hypothetical protein
MYDILGSEQPHGSQDAAASQESSRMRLHDDVHKVTPASFFEFEIDGGRGVLGFWWWWQRSKCFCFFARFCSMCCAAFE